MCIAVVPEGVIVPKYFEWKKGSENITDNGENILIGNYDLQRSESTSELTVDGEEVGNYVYSCTVQMEVFSNLFLLKSATANVTVKGKYKIVLPIIINMIYIAEFKRQKHYEEQAKKRNFTKCIIKNSKE